MIAGSKGGQMKDTTFTIAKAQAWLSTEVRLRVPRGFFLAGGVAAVLLMTIALD
jgi:hypothetical protein